ncbi:hypothetical protein GCM10009836_31110 [Pseudonocardia ailaonensis]|uniref:Major facilitator superfamily (MFS) profile domain-containing protein n=1 Tax=Pseudonocardia ailaonensis TaxID=367279 RepID=A0ABN2N218_9PSEU
MTDTADARPGAGASTGALRMLQLGVGTSSLDRFAIGPLLLMISADLGASLSEVAAAASAYFLAYGLLQPLWSILGDRIGLVRVMRIAMLVGGLSGLASAFAPNVLVLALLRTVTGACMGGMSPSGLVYIGTVWPEGIRQRALADIAVAASSGLALATAGAGLLGDVAGWRVVLGATAAAALLVALLLRRLPRPPRVRASPPLRAIGTVLRDRRAVALLVLAFVEGALMLGSLTYIAPAVEDLGFTTTIAGLAAAGFGVGVVLFSRLVRPLVGRLTTTGLAAIGGGFLVVGWAVPAAAVTLATAVVGGLLLGGAWAFLHSTLQNWATGVVPHERATAVALFATSLFLGSSAGTAIAAPAADAGAFDWLFRVTAVLSVLLAVAAPLAIARSRRRRD